MSACLQRKGSKQIVLAVVFSLAVLLTWWGFTSNNVFLVRDLVLTFFVPLCTWECYSCPTNVSTSVLGWCLAIPYITFLTMREY